MLAVLGRRPSTPDLTTPQAAITLATAAYRSGFAGWTPVQAVAKDTRPVPPVDGMATGSLWNCFEGSPVWADSDGRVYGAMELPLPGKLGFLRANGVGAFAAAEAPPLADALRAEPAACGSPPRYPPPSAGAASPRPR